MAKSDKPKTDGKAGDKGTSASESDAKIEDAEIVEDVPPEAEPESEAEIGPEADNAGPVPDEVVTGADPEDDTRPDAEAEPAPGDETPAEDEPEDTPDEIPETVDAAGGYEDTRPEATAAPPQQTVVVRKGGFFPLLLGGVVSAAIGFAAARYPDQWPFATAAEDTFRTDTQSTLETLDTRLTEQGQQLSALGDTVNGIDLGPLEQGLSDLDGRIADLRSSVETTQGGLEELRSDLSEIDTRLTDLAKRPIADTVSREAIAAYEDELARLRGTIEEQRAEIEETIAAEKAEIQAIADAATQIEEKAEAAARLANARGALNEIQDALDSGAPYTTALATLAKNTDAAIGEGLQAGAADGVSTAADLAERFPDAARAALAAVREATPPGEAEGSRLANFLRDQLQTRSVTPREGDDPDAVLSRAEAAMRNGDLDTALTEIEALPDVAQAELADWQADAAARRAAVADAAAVAQALDQE